MHLRSLLGVLLSASWTSSLSGLRDALAMLYRSAALGEQDGQTQSARTGIAMGSVFGVPTGTLLREDEWGCKSDHHEGHRGAPSMALPTTYRDYQYALPRIHFEGEQGNTSTGSQSTDRTVPATAMG
eukprot:6751969-Pyramimonas_sp.AAC.1